MGVILGSKVTNDNKIIFTVSLDPAEALQLEGHIEDVHLFSERTAKIKTNIASRGKNSATKYFLIPKKLRKNLKLSGEILCQKIETKTKVIFIFTVNKY